MSYNPLYESTEAYVARMRRTRPTPAPPQLTPSPPEADANDIGPPPDVGFDPLGQLGRTVDTGLGAAGGALGAAGGAIGAGLGALGNVRAPIGPSVGDVTGGALGATVGGIGAGLGALGSLRINPLPPPLSEALASGVGPAALEARRALGRIGGVPEEELPQDVNVPSLGDVFGAATTGVGRVAAAGAVGIAQGARPPILQTPEEAENQQAQDLADLKNALTGGLDPEGYAFSQISPRLGGQAKPETASEHILSFMADTMLHPTTLVGAPGGLAREIAARGEIVPGMAKWAQAGPVSLEQMGQNMADLFPTWAERMGADLNRLPGVSQVVRYLDPRLAPQSEAHRVGLEMAMANDFVNRDASVAGHYFGAPRFADAGMDVRDGLFHWADSDGKMQSAAVQTVLAKPGEYDIPPEARNLIGEAQDKIGLYAAGVDQAKAALAEVNPTIAARFDYVKRELGPGEVYIPHQVIPVRPSLITGEERLLPSEIPEFFKPPVFPTVEEGMAAGVKYVDDPGQIMSRYIREAGEVRNHMEAARLLTPLEEQASIGAKAGLKATVADYRTQLGAAEQILTAIDAARTGKTIPDITEAARVLPGAAEEATRLFKLTADPAAYDKLTALRESLESQGSAMRSSLDAAGGVLSRTEAGVHPPADGLISIQRNYTNGLWFSPTEAARLDSTLREAPGGLFGGALRGANAVSGVIRQASFNGDLSGTMLQTLPVAFQAPGAWAEGVLKGVQALWDRDVIGRAVAQNADVLARVPNVVVDDAVDMFSKSGMQALGDRLRDLPVVGSTLGRFYASFLDRTQDAFNAVGTISRIEYVKAMLPLFAREGKEAALGELANAITGATSSAGMGIGATQRMIESAVILNAPRWTRSVLAVVGAALNGGITGDVARDALGRLLFVAPHIYVNFAHAMDQEPELNPSRPGFLMLHVPGLTDAGHEIGVGGIWRATAKILGTMVTNPDSWQQGVEMNPLARFWRARSAPLTATLADFVSGENYVGTPVMPSKDLPGQVGDLTKYFGSKLLPVAIQGAWEERGGGPVPIAANILGMLSHPTGAGEARQQLAIERYGKNYEDLDRYQQAELTYDPRVAGLPPPQGKRFAGIRESVELAQKQAARIDPLAAKVATGGLTKSDFRARLDDINREFRGGRAEIEAINGPIEHTGPGKAVSDQIQGYFNILQRTDLEDTEKRDAAQAYLLSLQPDVARQITHPPGNAKYAPATQILLKQLEDARDTLAPYWGLRKQVYQDAGLWNAWAASNPVEQKAIEQTMAGRQAQARISQAQTVMRRTHADIDSALVDWYGRPPQNAVNIQAARAQEFERRQAAVGSTNAR